MKKLLQFLLKRIVSHPQKILIKEEEKENFLILKLKVHPEDLKIVIGKGGKTIKAIRELLYIRASQEGKKFNLLLEEDQKETRGEVVKA